MYCRENKWLTKANLSTRGADWGVHDLFLIVGGLLPGFSESYSSLLNYKNLPSNPFLWWILAYNSRVSVNGALGPLDITTNQWIPSLSSFLRSDQRKRKRSIKLLGCYEKKILRKDREFKTLQLVAQKETWYLFVDERYTFAMDGHLLKLSKYCWRWSEFWF